MKAHTASSINAYTLIIMGIWGYVATKAPTSFIPVVFGILLLTMNNGIRLDNKVQSHIAVLLTLLVGFALMKPLRGNIAEGDTMGIVRVGAMILTSVLAMVFFIKSFMTARKTKKVT